MENTNTAMPRKKLITALIMNIAVTVMALLGAYFGYHDAYLGGAHVFIYYTTDSNLLAALSCAIVAGFYIRKLRFGTELPGWAVILKYCAVCCLAVTMLVTVFILTPFIIIDPSLYGIDGEFTVWEGIKAMLLSPCTLFHHVLCPVVSFVSLVKFEQLPFAPKKCLRFAMIPTAVYAAVSITMNILKIWHGPYPFLLVYEQTVFMSFIWFIIVFGGAGLVSFLVAKCAWKKTAKSKP